MQSTISRLATLLKPGGMIVFRDYGRYDMAQLRFKEGISININFVYCYDSGQILKSAAAIGEKRQVIKLLIRS